MAYAIMRISKCKSGAIGRLEKHHERKKQEYKSNPDIDQTRSSQNFHIKPPPDSYKGFIQERIQEVGCRVRKDSVLMQDSFCSASPEFFQGKSQLDISLFFRRAYAFYTEKFGEANIVSSVVHMDEKTPHMHICFVPITKEGRLSSKTVIGGPQGLSKLQDEYYEHMASFYPELKRGIPKYLTHREHLPVYLFKNADLLMEHFDEISQAINDIGLFNGKAKRSEAIELISRYAPEMAKMKEQIKSVNNHVDHLKGEIRVQKDIGGYWKEKTEELEDEIKERDNRIFELQSKQQKLQQQINRLPPGLLDELERQEKERRRHKRIR